MLKILTAPNLVLLKSSPEFSVRDEDPSKNVVHTPEGPITLPVFVSMLVSTMYAAGDCCGLAAPQLGVSERILVYNPDENSEANGADVDKTVIMINPVITFKSTETEKEYETCLSLPGIGANIKRHQTIRVQYLDEDLKTCFLEPKGWEAKIIQHEIDHLDGKLFWDHLGPLKQAFTNKYRIAKRRNKRGK